MCIVLDCHTACRINSSYDFDRTCYQNALNYVVDGNAIGDKKANAVFTAHQLLNICKYIWSQCDFRPALDPQKFLSAFTAWDENNDQISFKYVGLSPAMDHTADVDAAILPFMQHRKDAWMAWKELMLRHAAVTPRVTYHQDIVELQCPTMKEYQY